jgi:hypothetical protein
VFFVLGGNRPPGMATQGALHGPAHLCSSQLLQGLLPFLVPDLGDGVVGGDCVPEGLGGAHGKKHNKNGGPRVAQGCRTHVLQATTVLSWESTHPHPCVQ